MNILGFEHYFNFLDHKHMEMMLASSEGEKLLDLARNISVCLHEDWKRNLVREKGKEYQHFRPVKDDAMAQNILANKDKFLSMRSDDGKPLYRILETEKNGQKNYEVQFDLIRVPFENLSKKWQEANLDAAKFALCLVKTATDSGRLDCTGRELFENFEMMAHDVHLEWIHREGGWAAPELLLPYEYLVVDTKGYNQKDKDRAHVAATTSELTFQPNIMARNRSIVVRAIKELFASRTTESGLNETIMRNIAKIQSFIDAQNEMDYVAYAKTKKAVADASFKTLKGKTNLSFEDLETLSGTYFEAWKESTKYLSSSKKLDGTTIGDLPKSVDVPYGKLVVDDPRVNYKNISRSWVKQILGEIVKEQQKLKQQVEEGKLGAEALEGVTFISPEILKDLDQIFDAKSHLGSIVAKQNERDFAEYQRNLPSNM